MREIQQLQLPAAHPTSFVLLPRVSHRHYLYSVADGFHQSSPTPLTSGVQQTTVELSLHPPWAHPVVFLHKLIHCARQKRQEVAKCQHGPQPLKLHLFTPSSTHVQNTGLHTSMCGTCAPMCSTSAHCISMQKRSVCCKVQNHTKIAAHLHTGQQTRGKPC